MAEESMRVRKRCEEARGFGKTRKKSRKKDVAWRFLQIIDNLGIKRVASIPSVLIVHMERDEGKSLFVGVPKMSLPEAKLFERIQLE
jgi:hypothetical protein